MQSGTHEYVPLSIAVYTRRTKNIFLFYGEEQYNPDFKITSGNEYFVLFRGFVRAVCGIRFEHHPLIVVCLKI